MRKVLIIGIGVGDPEHVTVQAIRALNRADVFFVLDKGTATADLARVRREICERYIDRPRYRFVTVADPRRNPAAASYKAGVDAWHEERAKIYERLIREQLDESGCGAFLVWGDPSLYDSTLRIIDRVAARGQIAFEHEVVPGITSAQVLAARGRTVLNEVGEPLTFTTGRRLAAEGLPADVEAGGSAVVMLDGEGAFQRLAGRTDLEIRWGANLGTAGEVLISGRLCDVADAIASARRDVRAERGWLMDIYLLRKLATPS